MAIDLSKGMLLDIPREKAAEQFGKLPPSALTRQDSLAIGKYRLATDTVRLLAVVVDWFNRPAIHNPMEFDSMLFS